MTLHSRDVLAHEYGGLYMRAQVIGTLETKALLVPTLRPSRTPRGRATSLSRSERLYVLDHWRRRTIPPPPSQAQPSYSRGVAIHFGRSTSAVLISDQPKLQRCGGLTVAVACGLESQAQEYIKGLALPAPSSFSNFFHHPSLYLPALEHLLRQLMATLATETEPVFFMDGVHDDLEMRSLAGDSFLLDALDSLQPFFPKLCLGEEPEQPDYGLPADIFPDMKEHDWLQGAGSAAIEVPGDFHGGEDSPLGGDELATPLDDVPLLANDDLANDDFDLISGAFDFEAYYQEHLSDQEPDRLSSPLAKPRLDGVSPGATGSPEAREPASDSDEVVFLYEVVTLPPRTDVRHAPKPKARVRSVQPPSTERRRRRVRKNQRGRPNRPRPAMRATPIQSLRIVKATSRLSEGTTTTFQWDSRRGWVDQYGEEVYPGDIGLPVSIETKGNYEVPIVFEWDEETDTYEGTIIGEEEAQISMKVTGINAMIFQPWKSIPVCR